MSVLRFPKQEPDPRAFWNAWLADVFGVATAQYRKALDEHPAAKDQHQERT